LNGRDAAKLSDAAAALRANGHAVHQRVFDVTVADQVNEAIDRIEADIGAIDILVNNAGGSTGRRWRSFRMSHGTI